MKVIKKVIFTKAKILDLSRVILNEQCVDLPNLDNKLYNSEYTLVAEISMTEHEMFYAIIPIFYITPELINKYNSIFNILNTKLPIKVAFKIIEEVIKLETPIQKISYTLSPINEHILSLYTSYIMDNRELNLHPFTEYSLEHIKQLFIDGKFILGSKDHLDKYGNINILDNEDYKFIREYFILNEEEKHKGHWRGFINYL